MFNKNIFKFADDGPGVAVVIRITIMPNRDGAEAHIAAGGAVEESTKRVWYSLVGTFGNVYELCTSLQTISIEFGLEWKDTSVFTASEPCCYNNGNAIGHPSSQRATCQVSGYWLKNAGGEEH